MNEKIIIDLKKGQVRVDNGGGEDQYAISTPEAFRLISEAWLRSGWDNKYVYGFTWLGRPIIQLPEDMIRLQEVIFSVQPDVIIETGIAHGGALCFYASLCKALGRGRVVGVDIEIRPHNRQAIESHPMFPLITLIEGSSIAPQVVEQVKAEVRDGETVLVLLDSCHTKEHVLAELEEYSTLVTRGSYIVAMDGIMGQVVGALRTQPDWIWNNPRAAAEEFVAANPDFAIEDPTMPFNEGNITEPVTYWPRGYIKRIN